MAGDAHGELLACIGTIYDAASGSAAWIDVGARIRKLFAAERASLVLPAKAGMPRELLAPQGEGEAAYAAYFHGVDPFRRQAQQDFALARPQHLLHAKPGAELVPDRELLRSEYYTDFGRYHARRHVMGGMLGSEQVIPVGLHRGESAFAFTPEDCRRLEMLLPHLQRALELSERLAVQTASLRVTVGVLDALPASMVLVDGGSKVRFANAASIRALARPGSGIAMLASGPRMDGGTHLTALHRDDARELRRLVLSAAQGGPGGSLRIRPRDDDVDQLPMQVALVSPAPPGMLEDADPATRAVEGLALVVVEDLVRRAAPPATMLCELFGLSRAEAEVAVGLVGGTSAEEVAQQRDVAVDTIRNQIRAILRKSEVTNLRDFERVVATLAGVGAQAPQRGRAEAALLLR